MLLSCLYEIPGCYRFKKDVNVFLKPPSEVSYLRVNRRSAREHALSLFDEIDQNQNGKIDTAETELYLGKFSLEEYRKMDVNSNGFIEPEEFDETLK
ncbi:hypothetical protein DdX_21150 [Ditylenchus destructor]|uniref:EF-hand domain-containing protein n=1 Tax=Ditylenchus destructor TaxID=166010 RepID=A0AAD4QVI9_9BILA|nr:hypothetical protein DdX_21150 [Ditylenchus destructor]